MTWIVCPIVWDGSTTTNWRSSLAISRTLIPSKKSQIALILRDIVTDIMEFVCNLPTQWQMEWNPGNPFSVKSNEISQIGPITEITCRLFYFLAIVVHLHSGDGESSSEKTSGRREWNVDPIQVIRQWMSTTKMKWIRLSTFLELPSEHFSVLHGCSASQSVSLEVFIGNVEGNRQGNVPNHKQLPIHRNNTLLA